MVWIYVHDASVDKSLPRHQVHWPGLVWEDVLLPTPLGATCR